MPAGHISDLLSRLKGDPRPVRVSARLRSAWIEAQIQSHHLPSNETSRICVTIFPNSELLEEMISWTSARISTDPNLKIRVVRWSGSDPSPFSPVSASLAQRIERLKTLSHISAHHSRNEAASELWLFATIRDWVQPTIPIERYESAILNLRRGDDIGSRDEWALGLRSRGYVKTEPVLEPGQYSIRGEIIDFFDPAQPLATRIELFDTEVESIRHFQTDTQRSLPEHLEPIRIHAAEEALFNWGAPADTLEKIKAFCDENAIGRKVRDPIFENIRSGFLPENYRAWLPFFYSAVGSISEYLPNAQVFVFHPEACQSRIQNYRATLESEAARFSDQHRIVPSLDLLYPNLEARARTAIDSASAVLVPPGQDDDAFSLYSEEFGEPRTSAERIRDWINDDYVVFIGTRGISQSERVRFVLGELADHPQIRLVPATPPDACHLLAERIVVIDESALLGKGSVQRGGRTNRGRTDKKKSTTSLGDFKSVQELVVGDYVVHSLHGVGRYLGLTELRSQGEAIGEYLLIEYAQGDKLYLPIYRLNLIQKHVGAAGSPTIDRLGTNQFEKTRQKAKESARKLAVNLLEIYAKRATQKGPRFEPTGEEYYQFVDQFQFTETEGQSRAIHDVLDDLESGKLLDRLVCGDVGFGKTEVAMRAAFQAVQSGHQVSVLVPTTLLAFQHEQTFRNRMKSFPIRIESISRFKTKREQTLLLKDLAEGKIDILIGTHRLLSKDVKFARLGLLIIDEEHRFGVDHKEKMKEIQATTHALTLTATPIPRTLNMALSGIKDISLIRTPPTHRQPIKTFVSRHSDELVRTALENELSRGGQVFYLYNRVQSIEHKARELQQLVPHAKIAVAHGQMSEDEIESRMLGFYQGQTQVLVCTTLIESGIDIPNAGTILIHRADQLGLAQLYQIRGRVGRSHRKSFAYLLVHNDETLSTDARQRLEALQRFVELGSGFQVASEDLEIRGGGNFLGPEQSGHVASVGMELFTEMIEEAIQELKGKDPGSIDEDRQFEPEIKVPVVCEIPATLVPDPQLRLSFYRKLSRASSDAEVEDLQTEFLDRFGHITPETDNLFWLIRIKSLLKRVGVETLTVSAEKWVLTARSSTPIDPNLVMQLCLGPKNVRETRLSLTPDSKLIFRQSFVQLKSVFFELENLFRRLAPKAFENEKSH